MSRRSMAAPTPHIMQECEETANCTELDVLPPTRGGFLTLRGSPTGYFYLASDGAFSAFKFESNLTSARPILKHDFGSGFAVMSAVYMRLNEKSDGVVVLTREARTGSEDFSQLTFFSFQTRRVLKRCEVRGRFAAIEICIDGLQREEMGSMKEALQSMENIFVIGGDDSLCYLANMGPISEDEPADDEFSALPKKVPLLRPNEDGLLEYNPRDNRAITKGFIPSSARVTSLVYMHERGLIAIGMSNGVLCSVSLRSGTCDSLMLAPNTKIERLCVQHPSDDADNYMYLWAQMRSQESTYLYLLSTVQQADAGCAFMLRFQHLPSNCDRFLQMRTVVLDKKQAMAIGSLDKADDEDSNSSFAVREHARFNQLMFFLYAEKHGKRYRLRGSVFDMDAYYSSRMPAQAVAHRKSPDQCGFLSHFAAYSEFSSCNVGDIMDALMVKIARFEPPGALQHIDQLFFPSALDFSLEVIAGSSVAQLNISCLQDQVIKDVSTKILKYYEKPSGITLFLHRIGLCNSLVQENETVMRACLFRILLHNFFPGCERFLEMEEVTEEQLHFFHKWLGKEVDQTKKRFDEESRLLFELPPGHVLRSTMNFVDHSQLVFRHASQLYERLNARFQKLNADEEIMQQLVVNKKICEDLLLQVSAILFGSHMDLLRETPEQEERMNRLRLKFAERLNIAARRQQNLEIHQIFEDVVAASAQDELFTELFAHRAPTDLYPPDSYVHLMDVLPHFGVTTEAKLQIIGYFAKDLDAITEEPIDRKYFNVACGYLLNDKMTDAAMSEMQAAWSSDQRLVRIDRMCGVPGMDELKRLSETDEKPYEEADLEFFPCSNEQEAQKLLALYRKFPYGVHKFNLNMVERRRYELLVDPPAQTEADEPEIVKRARSEVARIKRDFAHVFVKNRFEQEILDRCKEQANRPARIHVDPIEKDPLLVQMVSPRHRLGQQNGAQRPSFSAFVSTASPASRSAFFKLAGEEDEEADENATFETFPPRDPSTTLPDRTAGEVEMTPPARSDRFSDLIPRITPQSKRTPAPNDTTPTSTRSSAGRPGSSAASPYINRDASALLSSAMKQKQQARLQRLLTPVRLNRSQNLARVSSQKRTATAADLDVPHTPPNASDGVFKQPTSILRTNKRPRMLGEESRSIKFGENKRVHLIPNNQENRELALADTSLTEFLSDASGDEGSLSGSSPVRALNGSPLTMPSPGESRLNSSEIDLSIAIDDTFAPEPEPAEDDQRVPVEEPAEFSLDEQLEAASDDPADEPVAPQIEEEEFDMPLDSPIKDALEGGNDEEVAEEAAQDADQEVVEEQTEQPLAEPEKEAVEEAEEVAAEEPADVEVREEVPQPPHHPARVVVVQQKVVEQVTVEEVIVQKKRVRPPTPTPPVEELEQEDAEEEPEAPPVPKKRRAAAKKPARQATPTVEAAEKEPEREKSREPKDREEAENSRPATPTGDGQAETWKRYNLRSTPQRTRREETPERTPSPSKRRASTQSPSKRGTTPTKQQTIEMEAEESPQAVRSSPRRNVRRAPSPAAPVATRRSTQSPSKRPAAAKRTPTKKTARRRSNSE
ncbi:hypothetical protein M3Y99_01698400 [Aphelenchoides fujianensis]|nr:hypothetical protein M3Y99_01698400 [Aphelenchoides fujianensis]